MKLTILIEYDMKCTNAENFEGTLFGYFYAVIKTLSGIMLTVMHGLLRTILEYIFMKSVQLVTIYI